MKYGKIKSFGGKKEYILASAMEINASSLFFSFTDNRNEGDIFLRSVDIESGDVNWTIPRRECEGTFHWHIYKNYLIHSDQIIDAATGKCLFDFRCVPGASKKFSSNYSVLDETHLLFEKLEGDSAGSYFFVDEKDWSFRELSIGLQGGFTYERDIYGWKVSGGSSSLYRYSVKSDTAHLVGKLAGTISLPLQIPLVGYVLVTENRQEWFKISLSTGAVTLLALPKSDDLVFNEVGRSADKVYFSSISGLLEYNVKTDYIRAGLSPYYVDSLQIQGDVLYGIEWRRDDAAEHYIPTARSIVDGKLLWEGAETRNCGYLRVNEKGVFVGVAGGKIHYFPSQKLKKERGVGRKTKSAAASVRVLGLSSSSVEDEKVLREYIQEKVFSSGGMGVVAAAALNKNLEMVAFVEYLDDSDFPQLCLLDLKVDEIIKIESVDLIDAPMIDALNFKDGSSLVLGFKDGSSKVVALNIDERSVRWD